MKRKTRTRRCCCSAPRSDPLCSQNLCSQQRPRNLRTPSSFRCSGTAPGGPAPVSCRSFSSPQDQTQPLDAALGTAPPSASAALSCFSPGKPSPSCAASQRVSSEHPAPPGLCLQQQAPQAPAAGPAAGSLWGHPASCQAQAGQLLSSGTLLAELLCWSVFALAAIGSCPSRPDLQLEDENRSRPLAEGPASPLAFLVPPLLLF